MQRHRNDSAFIKKDIHNRKPLTKESNYPSYRTVRYWQLRSNTWRVRRILRRELTGIRERNKEITVSVTFWKILMGVHGLWMGNKSNVTMGTPCVFHSGPRVLQWDAVVHSWEMMANIYIYIYRTPWKNPTMSDGLTWSALGTSLRPIGYYMTYRKFQSYKQLKHIL